MQSSSLNRQRTFVKNNNITIFSAPKTFTGNVATIQYNAIKSWTLLTPRPEVILIGNENGIEDISQELGAMYIPEVKRNNSGTPLIKSIFSNAQNAATNDTMVYVNADIILFSDLIPAIQAITNQLSSYLVVGQRWDIDIDFIINYDTANWENKLKELAVNSGIMHEQTGIDYFVFNKNTPIWKTFPDLAVGRIAWDNISIYNALQLNIPVIDATTSITAVHQNHDYSHLPDKNDIQREGIESSTNKSFITGPEMLTTIKDATWRLRNNKLRSIKQDLHNIKQSNNNLCLFLTHYNQQLIDNLFKQNNSFTSQPYDVQKKFFQTELLSNNYIQSLALKKHGWRTQELFLNNELKTSWAKAHQFSGSFFEILLKQMSFYYSTAIFFDDVHFTDKKTLLALKPFTQLLIGLKNTPGLFKPIPYTYDIIFSSYPNIVNALINRGYVAYYTPHAFPTSINEQVGNLKKNFPVTYLNDNHQIHQQDLVLLKALSKSIPLKIWAETKPIIDLDLMNFYVGKASGLQKYKILCQSQLTINFIHGENENEISQLRMFEATGCGSLLITQYFQGLENIFEIGKEIVAYRTHDECVDLVNYFVNNPYEAEKIALAGQKRTLKDHTVDIRMKKIDEIIERHLRYKLEKGHLTLPQNISRSFKSIEKHQVEIQLTKAWQNDSIPKKQRGLTQKELNMMYLGNAPVVFKVMAKALYPIIKPQSSVLEIGCSTGYYYEILEYLLSTTMNYIGGDYSFPMIQMAKNYYPNTSFHVFDGAFLPYSKRTFSIVISSCILLHTPNYQEHIAETARVSNEYIVAHRTPICKKRITSYFTKYAYDVKTVELIFNENEFIHLFRKNGFELKSYTILSENIREDTYSITFVFKRTN